MQWYCTAPVACSGIAGSGLSLQSLKKCFVPLCDNHWGDMKHSGLSSPRWRGSIKPQQSQCWFEVASCVAGKPKGALLHSTGGRKQAARKDQWGMNCFLLRMFTFQALWPWWKWLKLRLTYTLGSSNSSHHRLTLSLCVADHIKLQIFKSETEFLQLQGVQGWALNLKQLFRIHLGKRWYTVLWNDWHKKDKEEFLAVPSSTKRIMCAYAGAVAVCRWV